MTSVAETTVGDRLREARDAAEMTQVETVEALRQYGISVSRRALVDYEQGRQLPRADYVAALARVTGTDPAWLVLGTDSPAYAKLERIRAILDEPASIASAEAAAPDAVAAVRREDRRRQGRRAADR